MSARKVKAHFCDRPGCSKYTMVDEGDGCVMADWYEGHVRSGADGQGAQWDACCLEHIGDAVENALRMARECDR